MTSLEFSLLEVRLAYNNVVHSTTSKYNLNIDSNSPISGKILNVREATHKQILENAEINNLIKILGLQYKKKYETRDDLKTLRYGKMMIMTDQDQVSTLTFLCSV